MKKFGAIFDFDGVLFHSEAQHEAAWRIVAEEEKKSFSRELFLQGFGVKNEYFISKILGWSSDPQEVLRLIEKKEKIFQERLALVALQPISGTFSFIEQLVQKGIPCAIASSSVRKNIDVVFAPYPSLQQFFSAFVTGEDVLHGKPDPEVFVLAAKKLDLPPHSCVVFEDAFVGIEAAKNAGMKVVGLATTFSEELLLGAHPDLVVQSLGVVSYEQVSQLLYPS